MRRGGASGTAGSRGSQSPGRGRGRGRAATRGGHSFTIDRGQSSRGGRGLGSTGAHISRARYPLNSARKVEHLLTHCSLPDNGSMPTQTYFNDARSYTSGQASRETKYHAQLNATIARLRSVPGDLPPTRPSAANKPTLNASSTLPPAPVQSRWGAVAALDPQAFLKFAGLGQSTSKPLQQPNSTTTGSANAAASSPAPLQPPAPSLPDVKRDIAVAANLTTFATMTPKVEESKVTTQTSTPVVAKDQVSGPVKVLPPHMMVKKEVGLASSRWAIPTPPVKTVSFQLPPLAAPSRVAPNQATRIQTIPPQPAPTATATIPAAAGQTPVIQTQSVQITAAQTDHTQLLRDHFVKIQRDNGPSRTGKARLVKVAMNEDLTLELVELDGTVIVREIIGKNSVFDHEIGTPIITFKSAILAATPLPTWTVYFQMPYQAKKFHELVFKNRQGYPTARPAIRRPPADKTQAPALPTSRCSSPVNSPWTPQPLEALVPAVPKASNETPSIFCASQLSTTQRPLPSQVALVSDIPVQQPEAKSDAVPSQPGWGEAVENLLRQEPIQLEQFDLPTPGMEHSSGTLINTEALNDMADVNGVALLISFEGAEPEPTEATGNSHGLNEICDEAMSLSTFLFLNSSPLGSLLDQLSRVVVKKGGSAAIGLTGDEILSCQMYMIAAYDLVGNFLSCSETFSRMPDDQSISMMKEQTRKVLELAVADREESIPTPATSPSRPAPSSDPKGAETEVQVVELLPDPASDKGGFAIEEHAVPEADSRITYSVQDLMGLRQNAAEFHEERLSDEVIHLARPQLASSPASNASSSVSCNITPTNTVQPTSHVTRSVVLSQQESLAPQATASTVPTASPTKPQSQQTDMNLWHTMLNKVKGGKAAIVKPVVIEALVEPAQTKGEVAQIIKQEATTSAEPVAVELPVVSQGVQGSSKHKTSNSDYERLAKTLDGFHLNAEIGTVASPTTIANDAASQVQATPQGRTSLQPSRETPKLRLMEESILSRLSSPTLPSTLSPQISARPLPATNASARLQALGAQLSPPPKTAVLAPSATSAYITEPRAGSTKAEVQNGASVVKLVESSATLPDAAPSHTPTSSRNNEPTRSTAIPPITSAQVLSPPRPLSGAYANIHVASNSNLRGVPGLAASRWSTGGQGFTPSPTIPPYTPVATHSYMHGATTNASQIPGSVPSRPPMPLPSNLEPIYQTVLVQDAQGNYREVTGMVKTGSIPIVAHQIAEQQLPPVTPPNLGFTPVSLPTPTAPFNFPARPDMYNHHISPDSGSPEQNFKPDATPFRPSTRGRADEITMPGARLALSPVRKGENVQAKLQSRLTNSLAGRGSF